MRHRALLGVSAVCLCLIGSSCSAQQPSASPTGTAVPPTASPVVQPSPSPTAQPTTPPDVETLTEPFDHGNFADPTTIDNTWLPLVPGTQWTWDGEATVDGERVSRRVIIAVTDLTKQIDGVRVVVTYDQDITDGVLQEAELAFFAQDDDGLVWRMGEYPEEYEDGEFVEAPLWLAGLEDALAGIQMQAEPRLGTLSYSEGWGPKVGWNDRARIFDVGSETCVPFACYADVLVVDEFNRDSPDAHQLKYYAPGVGNVRTGWAGALEEEQEVLELTDLSHLSGEALTAIREKALALEAHAYTVSPGVYGQTDHLEPPPN
jgi:hypothetical protein